MEFVKTERGGIKLLFEGYSYTVDKTRQTRTYWKCVNRKIYSARLTTVDNIITGTPSEHSHPTTPIENSVVKIKEEEIKIRAERSEQLPSSMINDVTSDMCLSVAGALPKEESLKGTVRRKRPVVREEELVKTPRGDDFLLYENEDIFIFGTKKNLEILSKRTEWFCDGTFDSAPLGKQLYLIHALLSENKTMPLLYCITSSKSEGNYNSIFKFIRGLPDI